MVQHQDISDASLKRYGTGNKRIARLAMDRIPCIVVTGFLGSGKTTLLKNLLDRWPEGIRMGLVQNEFAASGCDAEALRTSARPFELMEINGGSVFCVCRLGIFVEQLTAFVQQRKPDVVMVEASGLSDPLAVTEVLTSGELSRHIRLQQVWAVVDSLNYLRMEKLMSTIRHQILVADTVLLNKTDLVAEPGLKALREHIGRLNPLAQIVETSYCDADPGWLFDVAMRNTPGHRKSGHIQREVRKAGRGHLRPDVGVGILRTGFRITESALWNFLRDESNNTYRIKGLAAISDGRMLSVQTCPGQVFIGDSGQKPGRTELVAIGPDLDIRIFSAHFRSLAE